MYVDISYVFTPVSVIITHCEYSKGKYFVLKFQNVEQKWPPYPVQSINRKDELALNHPALPWPPRDTLLIPLKSAGTYGLELRWSMWTLLRISDSIANAEKERTQDSQEQERDKGKEKIQDDVEQENEHNDKKRKHKEQEKFIFNKRGRKIRKKDDIQDEEKDEYEVEEILDKEVDKDRNIHYLVKWLGYTKRYNSRVH